eukprot:5978537-Pyramimonas_sp.AAC.1
MFPRIGVTMVAHAVAKVVGQKRKQQCNGNVCVRANSRPTSQPASHLSSQPTTQPHSKAERPTSQPPEQPDSRPASWPANQATSQSQGTAHPDVKLSQYGHPRTHPESGLGWVR